MENNELYLITSSAEQVIWNELSRSEYLNKSPSRFWCLFGWTICHLRYELAVLPVWFAADWPTDSFHILFSHA